MNTKDFKTIVLPLSERIYPMAVRMLGNRTDAEDAIQEIMIKLWEKRKKMENHPNIPGFVFLTARNYCFDLLKKNRIKIDSDSSQLEIVKEPTSQNQMEWKELTSVIEGFLEHIPEQQREVMLMRDFDGLEFAEIAAALQLKIGHVRVLLSRARKQVGMHLKNTYSYE